MESNKTHQSYTTETDTSRTSGNLGQGTVSSDCVISRVPRSMPSTTRTITNRLLQVSLSQVLLILGFWLVLHNFLYRRLRDSASLKFPSYLVPSLTVLRYGIVNEIEDSVRDLWFPLIGVKRLCRQFGSLVY